MKKFNNRENEEVKLPDGRTIWLSRSVAVVGTVCVVIDGVSYFLIAQRGPNSADFKGLWNLPCGYLDWDETSYEAFQREVYEETGFDVKGDKIFHLLGSLDPWDISSDPKENRQNVTLHHYAYIGAFELPELKVDGSEVSDAKWVKEDELDNYEFAFNHRRRLKEFIDKISRRKLTL